MPNEIKINIVESIYEFYLLDIIFLSKQIYYSAVITNALTIARPHNVFFFSSLLLLTRLKKQKQ